MTKYLILMLFLCSSQTLNAKKNLSTKTWVKFMKSTLPKHMCRKNAYLSTCYNIEPNKCQKVLKTNLNKCFTSYGKIKNRMSRKKSKKYSKLISKCIRNNIIRKHPTFSKRSKRRICNVN